MKKKIKITISYDDGSIEEVTGSELKKLLWNLDHTCMMPSKFFEYKKVRWKRMRMKK